MKPETETLAKYVSRIMEESGLSAADVERRSGSEITDGYIKEIRIGKQANISASKIVALAKGLGISPYDIFTVSIGDKPEEHVDTWLMYFLTTGIPRIARNARLAENVKALLKMNDKQLAAAGKALKRIKSIK